MKIGIYAACKNELENIDAWYLSCKQADVICVADTGSTDGSVERLRELGAIVNSIVITPWRFDDAFNMAMYSLPADVDVCIRLDLDERLDVNWRSVLESIWTPETTQVRYPYVWNWNADGSPGLTWYCDRIHSRSGWRWRGATHEGLCGRTDRYQAAWTDELRILHFAKHKDKSHDLSLLQEAMREAPDDARIMAYLGREYMYQGMHKESTETYKKFLTLSGDMMERCQAMVNLSNVDPENKVYWLKTACQESPYHREPRVELAQYYHNTANWQECWRWSQLALSLTNKPGDYTCTAEAWGWKPHDLASLAAWNLRMFRESLEQAGKALALNPTDQRLQSNWQIVKDFYDREIAERGPDTVQGP